MEGPCWAQGRVEELDGRVPSWAVGDQGRRAIRALLRGLDERPAPGPGASMQKQQHTAIKATRTPSHLGEGFVPHGGSHEGPPRLPRERPAAGLRQPPTSSHTQTLRRARGAQRHTRGDPGRRPSRIAGATGAKDKRLGQAPSPYLHSGHFLM